MTTTNSTKPARFYLPLDKKMEIADIIKQHAKKENGLCVYDLGWSDSRVCEHFAGTVTLWNVQDVRTRILGKLKTINKDKKNEDAIFVRIDKLEKQVSLLLEIVEQFTKPSK